MIPILVQILKDHPEQAIDILQRILDILKTNPALMAQVIALISKK